MQTRQSERKLGRFGVLLGGKSRNPRPRRSARVNRGKRLPPERAPLFFLPCVSKVIDPLKPDPW